MNTEMGSAFPAKKLDKKQLASWEYKMHEYLVGQVYWSYVEGAHKNQPSPELEKDICGKHDYTKVSTPPRVEQYSIQGYIHEQLHLEDQGDVQLPRVDQCQH